MTSSNTTPIYAIGDIHGQLNELHRVLALIEQDGGRDAQIVFLGDYTDRGPDSRGVIDLLIEGKNTGRNWTFIKGNHDQMFELFMQSPPQHDPYIITELYWLHPRLGGDTTLASYGVTSTGRTRLMDTHAEALAAVPQSHVDFLKSLTLSYEHDELFFCHAGVRPEVPLDRQNMNDLIWIRKEFHDYTASHPKVIVHGHTPVDEATHYGNRINLDTGAGYNKPLTAAVFEGGKVWTLSANGRTQLSPTKENT
jgi:serine/threonine protein phosphatase 1